MKNNTFGNYQFPSWVCVEVAQQIMNFWGQMGRDHKDWLDNAEIEKGLPKLGEEVICFSRAYRSDDYEKIEGKFIHAWNNMGRIVKPDNTYSCVSSCDYFISKPSKADK